MNYKIDQWLSKTGPLVFFLTAVIVGMTVFGGIFLNVVGRAQNVLDLFVGGDSVSLSAFVDYSEWQSELETVPESFWKSWTYMGDPGTHADEEGWLNRAAAIVVCVGGIIYFAAVIGFTVDAINVRMAQIKMGKSAVVEKNHYLMLGFTPKSPIVIKELCEAMSSEGGGVLVILCERTKPELEAELRIMFPKKVRKGTRFVCRTGNIQLQSDLSKASASNARACIVLAAPGDPDKADAVVLRTVLSLRGLKPALNGHVVAELRDADNRALVDLVGGDMVESIVSHDIVGRLMIKSARMPGLATVYGSFLGFDGDELYMENWPKLKGKTFGDVRFMFKDAVPIGVQSQDAKGPELNPPDNYVMQRNDRLLVIAEDDDTYKPGKRVKVDSQPSMSKRPKPKVKEKMLLCGWRRDIDDVVILLNRLMAPGSTLTLLSSVPLDKRIERLEEAGKIVVERDIDNIVLDHKFGNTASRRSLVALNLQDYDSIIILADEEFEEDVMHSDSHSLACLLLIRNIQAERCAEGFVNVSLVVCEILDSRTREMVALNNATADVCDYIMSNEVVGSTIAMVAETRENNLVLSELLGKAGCDLNVVPSQDFINAAERINFWELTVRVRRTGQVLVGWIRWSMKKNVEGIMSLSEDPPEINPKKKSAKLSWGENDCLIVLTKRSNPLISAIEEAK